MLKRSARRRERGAVLIAVVVVVVVLTVVGLALVARNSDEIDAAGAKRRYDVSVTCADGARDLLLSQFRTFGANPTSISFNTVVGDKTYTTGHYNNFALTSVVPTTGASGRVVGVSDATNRTTGTHLGGQVYRMTVVCSDTNQPTRQDEIEFLVRFGF